MGAAGREGAGLVLALLAALLSLAACGTDTVEKGSCVTLSGADQVSSANCAGEAWRVLDTQDGPSGTCADVAGVTHQLYDGGRGNTLCLGALDTDPAGAVNVARVGDCLTGTDDTTTVRRLPCADQAATHRVLQRLTDATDGACGDVAGATTEYAWSIRSTDAARTGPANDVLLCLGPARADPTRSVDAAQEGSCLRQTTDEAGWTQVDCARENATDKVLRRVEITTDGAPLDADGACAGTSATSSISRARGQAQGYLLCVGPA